MLGGQAVNTGLLANVEAACPSTILCRVLQFNISKLQMVEAEKKRVKAEFERREGAIEVKKKVRLGSMPAMACVHACL